MHRKLLTLIAAFVFLSLSLKPDGAEARRRKKYKGPIIVNQILRLDGTMTDNGAPTTEFAGIKEGDVLETGPKSSAVIRIPGLGIYRLGENTKVRLAKFGGRDISKFEVNKGDFLCIYKRLGSHEVSSLTASVHPNGNSASNTFWLSDLEKKSVVALWDGKIDIKAKNAPAEVPAQAPSPTPTPTPSPTKEAELKASNVPVDSKIAPTVEPKPIPMPINPKFVSDITATAKNELLRYVITPEKGLEQKEEPGVAPPDSKIIKDMESLYALP